MLQAWGRDSLLPVHNTCGNSIVQFNRWRIAPFRTEGCEGHGMRGNPKYQAPENNLWPSTHIWWKKKYLSVVLGSKASDKVERASGHRGVKLAAARMIGLDDLTSSSSDELGSASSADECFPLYDWCNLITPNKAYPYCAVEQMPLSEISYMRLSLVPDG